MFNCLQSLLQRRRCQPTSALAHLPTELLLEIVGYLASSIPALRSLARTNRRFHLLVTPLLLTAALNTRDRFDRSVIRRAAARGDVGLLRRLLVHGNGAGVDERAPITGTTALQAAIMLERRETVTVLLQHGAGVDVGDRKGWSALHWAVLSGDCNLAEEVLDHRSRQRWEGGDGDRLGTTPLHMAVARGDTEMVRLLVRWGADVDVEDEFRVSAVDYALALLEDGVPDGGDGDNAGSKRELVGLVAAVASCREARVGKMSYDRVMREKRSVGIRRDTVVILEEWLARQK